MLDLNDYVFFPEGTVEIGIDPEIADEITDYISSPVIKKDYISASTPKKTVRYNSFFIQKKLISVENFRKFVIDTLYVTESEKEGWGWVWNGKWIKKKGVSWENPFLNDNDSFYSINSDIFPVMQVSWNDAVEYTKWLSSVTGDQYRLPFEYEWEILGKHAGLNSMSSNLFDGHKEKITSDEDFILSLSENIKISEFQLGILWEWTLDWYNGYDENIINKDFGNIYKILRGGSLLSETIQKTKEFRFRRCPTARSPYYGYRIVLDVQNM